MLGLFVHVHGRSLLDRRARLGDIRQVGVGSAPLLQDGFEIHRAFRQFKTAKVINLTVASNRVQAWAHDGSRRAACAGITLCPRKSDA
jgi:hypothetical protein